MGDNQGWAVEVSEGGGRIRLDGGELLRAEGGGGWRVLLGDRQLLSGGNRGELHGQISLMLGDRLSTHQTPTLRGLLRRVGDMESGISIMPEKIEYRTVLHYELKITRHLELKDNSFT